MTSVSVDRRQGVNSGAAIKVPCKAATVGNATLSGEQTIDGVALVSGDRVLVRGQTNGVDNGIYVVDTGTWQRALDFDGVYDVLSGTLITVLQGATYAQTVWRVSTTGTIIPGTTSMAFQQAVFTDSATLSFIQAGTGAVSRTAQDKMRDIISVHDFGAVGDGVTDDTAAIQAALDAAGIDHSVSCKGGKNYLCTDTILVGGTLTRASALVCEGRGRATLTFNLASHTKDGVALRGYRRAGVIYGMEFMPTKLAGFYINMQNTGRDGVVQFESDMPVLEDLAVLRPYRMAFSFLPTVDCWIENPYARNLLASKCGQHGFYFGTLNANSYINDGTWIDCEVRGVGINSVVLGINKVTQPDQLGCAIYVISHGTTTGDVAGHTWVAFTADCGSSYAVANGSAPNPDAVFFADGRNAKVIEGAGVPASNRTFIQWRFITPRIEDTAAGGFTTGSAFGRESTSVSLSNLWIDALSGGNWGAMTLTPNLADDGTYVGSADYAGALRRIRWNGSFDFNGVLAVDATNVSKLTATGVASQLKMQAIKGASFGNIASAANANITAFGEATAGLLLVTGSDGSGNEFCDLQAFRWFGGTGVGSIIKKDTIGTPSARTYTIDGGTGEVNLALSATAGSYAIRTMFLLPTGGVIP